MSLGGRKRSANCLSRRPVGGRTHDDHVANALPDASIVTPSMVKKRKAVFHLVCFLKTGPTGMMLLYVSSGAADHLGRVLYDREDLAGDIAFEAADDLALTQPLSGAAKHVCPGAGDRD